MTIEDKIARLESTLVKYEKELQKNPDSLFSKGMVKNTRELLMELKNELELSLKGVYDTLNKA